MNKLLIGVLLLFSLTCSAQEESMFATMQPLVSVVPNGFTAYRSVTIDYTKISGATKTNYVVTISGTLPELKTVANGGKVQNTATFNGQTVPADAVFTSDAGGTTPMSYDWEFYDQTTGDFVAHVKFASISNSVNTVAYLFYGKSSVTTYQGGSKGAAWDANYLAIWHGNGTVDATSNNANLTANGTGTPYATGKVGNCFSPLNANSNYWSFSSIPLSSNYTIEYWANITSQTVSSIVLGRQFNTEGTNFTSGKHRLFNTSVDEIVDATTTPTNTWAHLVITRTSGGSIIAYHDGVQTATNTGAGTRTFNQLARRDNTNSANIKIDEIRISNVVRDADDIATRYNNLNSPSTFYTISSEL